MEIGCPNKKCYGVFLKSYGSRVKLRANILIWDAGSETAIAQCKICKSQYELPISLKVTEDQHIILEIRNEKPELHSPQKLIIPEKKLK